ncbi:unnamed protein product [Blepharisma stoltei]|uniref:Uncharacterized protein n=1 Tax=Blepharisma stoltei TaxID=1481888 RepID=A0AAU9JIP8_9CILI|nr:unnamed protein product [Blepharisma stoltei]
MKFFLILLISLFSAQTNAQNNSTAICVDDLSKATSCQFDEDCPVIPCFDMFCPLYVSNCSSFPCYINRCVNGKCIALTRMLSNKCQIGGCSSELCVFNSTNVNSPCIWKNEYACYQAYGTCGFTNCTCGWIQTNSLMVCLNQTSGNATNSTGPK